MYLNPHRASCLISGILPDSLDFNVYSSEIWLSGRFNEVALVTPWKPCMARTGKVRMSVG